MCICGSPGSSKNNRLVEWRKIEESKSSDSNLIRRKERQKKSFKNVSHLKIKDRPSCRKFETSVGNRMNKIG